MNIKQFLKPDWRKIVLSFIIFSLLPVFSYQLRIVCEAKIGGYCPPYIVENTSLLASATKLFDPLFSLDIMTIIFLPLGLVISYIISSYTLLKVRSLTSENKEEINKSLKPTKGKFIISILGWITVGFVFLNFLSGLYGGTSNFPPILNSIFNFYSSIIFILFPFTILTMWILFYATGGIVASFFYLTKLPLDIIGDFSHPGHLTIFGGVFVILALILEWYLLSCLIVWIYDKVKKKK
jgi:hypothetical protein